MGLTLTSKLNWRNHFSKCINKCRNNLNLLKVITAQKWGENTSTLRTLAIALIRSKLTYAQEIFFSTSKSELKKLQSLDCKAFRIALKVPLHTNNLNTYNEMKILPLDYYRQAQTSKFIIKTLSLIHI